MSGHRTRLTLGGGRAVLTLNGKVIADDPYTPASDYPRARIAAGLCPGCPDGKGITTGWNGTTELLKCDTCPHSWFRGHPSRQEALFDAPAIDNPGRPSP
jgi:hypothetical protein